MRLLELRVKARQEAIGKIDDILNRAAEEDGRELREEEDSVLSDLRAAVDKLDEQIRVLEEDQERSERSMPAPRVDTRQAPPAADVKVRSEPGTYEGPPGFRRMLVDLAISQGIHRSADKEFAARSVDERLERYAVECRKSDDMSVRSVEMSDLGGIVNPQFDPTMVSRGIYDAAVTLGILRRYPVWSNGDSITMPRVTGEQDAAIQVESAAFDDNDTKTTAVKADLFTVGAKTEMSVQSIERGVLAVELVRDEMQKAWYQRLNNLILLGSGAAGNPDGLLRQVAGTASRFIEKDDNAPSAQKALDYLTDAKVQIFKDDRRRPTAYVTSPGVIGLWEQLQQNGLYTIPPYDRWAQNVGGAGTLPEREGPVADFEWRRVPVFADAAYSDAWKDNGADNGTGGDQSRILALVADEVPVFYDGPMTFTYEQTLASKGQVLLVARGYAAFNPMWRPEAWKVVRGTGLKLGA